MNSSSRNGLPVFRRAAGPYFAGLLFAASILLAMTLVPARRMWAQAPAGEGAKKIDLGIVVLPTLEEAQAAMKLLKSGYDFSVLAKEKSTDATAPDGGYLGKVDPAELRVELRDAIQGRATGGLTDIIHLPSGYAIVKLLAVAPPQSDLNPQRISSLIATGAIRIGPYVSGITEANEVFSEYVKGEGWNLHDLSAGCQLRKDSLDDAESSVSAILANKSSGGTALSPADQMQGHSSLAQLYGYSGEMEQSIREWKAAYDLAQTADPASVPNLEESLGTAYLHWSEMQNNVYTGNTNLDFFPPLDEHASFARTDASKEAIAWFLKYLEQTPNDLEVRWLLNLAYETLGEYPSGVPAAYVIPEADFKSKDDIGRFRDVAPAARLNVMREAGGVIVDDFDNDGLLDVMASSMDMCDPIRYFHNNGDGTFSDWTEKAGLMNQLGGLNIVEADYNNDGCMDLLILRGGWEFPQRMSLMRNNCDGTFTDVTDASGLGSTFVATQAAAWADIDNDGYLDLFVVNEKGPAKLFHNKRDGTFEEIGASAGIDKISFNKGVAAADYDGDGWMDFYVTNLNGVNYLYHNNGNLTFTEVARQAGVQGPSYSFATWFFDYDNDGWPDLFVASYLPSVEEAVKTYVGGEHNAETMKLYRNRHDGTFEDVTQKVGLDKVFMIMGANFGDVDNDGYLDFYLGAGQPSYTSPLPHALFRNEAGKRFEDITESSGTGELHKGHGIAFADLTRRGLIDIVAGNGGAVPGDKHTLRLYQNPGNRNNWLNVRLVGVKSNREALGAQIHVTVQDGDSPPRSIYRTVGQTSSFGGNPVEQHIGLGLAAHPVTLDIFWPASNTRQHFEGVAVNQYIQIKEFATSFTRREFHPFQYPSAETAGAAATPVGEPVAKPK